MITLLLSLLVLLQILIVLHFFLEDSLSQKNKKPELICKLSSVFISGNSKTPSRKYRIALVASKLSDNVRKIHSSFIHTLSRESTMSFECETYIAPQFTSIDIYSTIESILHTDVDLIVPIGALASEMAKKVTEENRTGIPIIFCGVKDPVERKLIGSATSSGNHLTGVSGAEYNYLQQYSLLKVIRPKACHALIAYNPIGGSLAKDVSQITKILADLGIKPTTLEISHLDELIPTVSELSNKIDIIITLRDAFMFAHIHALTQLCNKESITLFASHLEAAHAGVAVCYGTDDTAFGASSARLARNILQEGKKPSELPLVKLNENQKVLFNSATMLQQGIVIDPAVAQLICKADVI